MAGIPIVRSARAFAEEFKSRESENEPARRAPSECYQVR